MSVTPNNPASISRRDFLKLISKGLLGVTGVLAGAGLLRFLSYQSHPSGPTQFDLGLAGQYPPGSRTLLPQAQAFLLHTAGGFTALNAVCPHLGCTLETDPSGFICPCHRSTFDRDGKLMKGPATHSLGALRVEAAANGHLILHTG